MNPGFELKLGEVSDAIDGNSVAVIEGPLRDFDEVTSSIEVDRYYFGFIDYLYLSQSVNCADFVNKHLHVSGYFRVDKTNVKKHIAHYNKWLEENLKNQDAPQFMAPNRQEFNQYNPLIDYHDIELYVFVQTKNRTYLRRSTGVEKKNITSWQRLNLAIDVPSNCKMLTISAFFRGTGSIQWDGFVVNEQGDKLEAGHSVSVPIRNYGDSDIKLALSNWYKKYKKRKEFDNLGFEVYRK